MITLSGWVFSNRSRLRAARQVGRRQQRQIDNERAAASGALAVRRDVSAVLRHEIADQREPDAQTVRAAAIGPDKRIEDPLEHVALDADSGVANRDDGAATFLAARDRDVGAFRRVVAGVAEQIAEHLFQPNRVAFDEERRIQRRLDLELLKEWLH